MEDDSNTALCVCGNEREADDMVIHPHSGEPLCEDCVYSCNRCGDIGDSNDSWSDVDSNIWCDNCTDRYASWCDREEAHTEDSSYYVNDLGENWCQNCIDSYASWCESCDEYTEDGCQNDCNEDYSDGERVVHDYSYRPDAIFHSTEDNARLFFGMEIEVEAENYDNRREAAQFAQTRLEVETSLGYLKNDGSLNCGFEVVTHPMTYDFFMNEATEFWDTIDKLKYEFNMKSWATRTCGLHIHISRSGFNGPAHTHRFLNLIYSNQAFYQEMAGRSASSWAKFDDAQKWNPDTSKWDKSFKHKIADPTTVNTDRYSAVNTNNRATLEMRIFKGSINTTNVRGALGLAHASVEYTRTMSLQEVKDGGLTTAKFIDYINSKPELYADVITRMGKCPSIEAFMLYNRAQLAERN